MIRVFFIAWMLVALLAPALSFSAPSREAELRGAVEGWLTRKTASLGWEARIRRIQVAPGNAFPNGALEYEVVAPDQWEGWGAVSLAVVVRQNGRVLQNVPVRLEVEALAEVVVATRQIDHGSVISASDLALQKRDLAGSAGRLVRATGDAIGKKARITFKANQPLRSDQLEKIPLVKAGQLVTIVAENESIKVSVAGRARGAGAEGDVIMVQNMNSLKEIPARVISATTVQVSF